MAQLVRINGITLKVDRKGSDPPFYLSKELSAVGLICVC